MEERTPNRPKIIVDANTDELRIEDSKGEPSAPSTKPHTFDDTTILRPAFTPREEPTGMFIPKRQPFVAPVFRTESDVDEVFKFDWIDGAEPLTSGEFATLARLIDGNHAMISYYIDKGSVDELPNQSLRAVLSKLSPSDNQVRSESEMSATVLNKISAAIAESRNSGQAVRFEDSNMQRIWQYFLTRSTHSRLLAEISEKFGPRINF